MIWAWVYAIGFVISFLVLSIWEATRDKKYAGYDGAEFHVIFLYSIVWPFVWIYTLINLIFG